MTLDPLAEANITRLRDMLTEECRKRENAEAQASALRHRVRQREREILHLQRELNAAQLDRREATEDALKRRCHMLEEENARLRCLDRMKDGNPEQGGNVISSLHQRLRVLEQARHIDALRHIPFRLRAWTDQQAILWLLTRDPDAEPLTPRELAEVLDLRLSSVEKAAACRPRLDRDEIRRAIENGELVSRNGERFHPRVPTAELSEVTSFLDRPD